jgi:hypothetical protein
MEENFQKGFLFFTRFILSFGEEEFNRLREWNYIIDKDKNLVSKALVLEFVSLFDYLYEHILDRENVLLIGEFAQSFNTNTFNRRPKNLKGSLDELASEIIASQHYFKNQMKDTFLTELVGQSIVHHHVRDELGESKQNVGLVFVVVE